MEVQLVIKAPNQNVEDHTVNCTLDWTVKALKEHLSIAYPNEPAPNEQKLIYSGRLLPDHLLLKEFLRHDDSQDNVHILHLVYNGRSPIEQNRVPPNVNDPNATPISNHRSGQSSENVLRHRNATSMPLPPQTSPFYQTPTSAPFAPVFMPDSQTAAQMAAMQQMYAYYLMQYMQQGTQPSAVAGSNPVFPVYEQNQVPNQAAAQRPENVPRERVVAEENEEGMNHDWLDHLFLGLRCLLFIALLHLYSTPERLMIVFVCVLVVFLYHEGWFVRRRHPPVPVELPPDQPDNVNIPQQGEEPLVNPPDPGANDEVSGENEIQATMDGNNPPHAQQPEEANNQTCSPLTFVSSFFSSLIPEPPPPAVNIN